LIEDGAASRAAVVAALRHQLRGRLDRLFELQGVRLRFHVARRTPVDQRRVPLSPHEFLHGRPRTRDRERGSGPAGAPRSGSWARDQRVRALAVLGLAPNAAPDAVRTAFRRLAREVHPDRHPAAGARERAELLRRFAELSAAYHALVA
jgi:DnaJ-domain-containing protein 1